MIAAVTRGMAEQASAAAQVTTAVESMRKESDQAARAMTDQGRALKEIAGATTSMGKQIRLLSGANNEHSGGATRVLTQLKSIRAVSERNTQSVRQTRGSTGELVNQAEALRAALGTKNRRSRGNGSNGHA
jgi:methyl-accepting chemotaxis protein